jgi:hypothetical protein
MKKQDITRRDLLKVLAAAGGGITAAAFLPEKWVKPVVNSGVLPVHAQASGATGTITGTVYQCGGGTVANQDVTITVLLTDPLKTGNAIANVGVYTITGVPAGT